MAKFSSTPQKDVGKQVFRTKLEISAVDYIRRSYPLTKAGEHRLLNRTSVPHLFGQKNRTDRRFIMKFPGPHWDHETVCKRKRFRDE